MNPMSERSPTGSYVLLLPERVHEEQDARVTSYWLPGDEVLLQLSSTVRSTGDQMSATARMQERLGREVHSDVVSVTLQIPACDDVAAVIATDANHDTWLFVYAVWPSIAIFATVSDPSASPADDSWACAALRTLRLA